jgi:hypothetical protein
MWQYHKKHYNPKHELEPGSGPGATKGATKNTSLTVLKKR